MLFQLRNVGQGTTGTFKHEKGVAVFIGHHLHVSFVPYFLFVSLYGYESTLVLLPTTVLVPQPHVRACMSQLVT